MPRTLLSRREALLGGSALALAGAARADDAPGKARVESLGQPCVSRNVLSGRLVRDGGRDWLVLGNMNESSGMELIFIDPQTDEGQVYRAPAGSGAWALLPVSGSRLAVGTYFDGAAMLFDVPGRKWLKTVHFPGEQYFWTFALGGDGRVYGGTYPGGKLGALDLAAGTIEDLGAPAPPNLYLRYTTALPDGRVLCQFGMEKPKVMVFDPATKRFSDAPEAVQKVTLGVGWNGWLLFGKQAFRMPDLAEAAELPFPAPPADGGDWSVEARLSDARTLILRQGTAVYRFRPGDAALTRLPDVKVPGVTLYAVGEGGELYGVRGQDYCVIRPGEAEPVLKPIPGKSGPRPTHFLHVDAQERVWGGPSFGQTLFYFDAKTGRTTNTRTISDHGGEAYDVEVVDGICYAVAYVGGEVIRYDPSAPWDQIHHVNPRTIARVPGYIRPFAGLTRGPDGRLYAGWWAKYGTYGGAVSITDPATGKTEVIENPLGPHGIGGLSVAGDHLLIGTTTGGNGLPKQAGQSATFGVYALKTRSVVSEHPFPGSATISNVVYDPASGLAALLVDGKPHLFDPAKLAWVGDGPVLSEKVTSHAVAVRDGHLLYGQAETLFRLDLRTRKATPVATLPAKVDCLAFGPAQRIYVTCGVDLYRVSDHPR